MFGFLSQDIDSALFSYDFYLEICLCDTPLCNVNASKLEFFCHAGDFEQSDLVEDVLLLNQTSSCYTNRNQCFVMKYESKADRNISISCLLSLIPYFPGVFGSRVRFGCAPLNFQNQKPNSWMITDYKSLNNVEVYSCYSSLCNSVEVILK